MIISHENKYIFIHVPKNAGTSIEVSLINKKVWQAEEKHLTALECLNKVGEEVWANYFTFCFVRNPWDRLVSQYKFSGQDWGNKYFEKPLSFKGFVKQIVEKRLPFSKHDHRSKLGLQNGDSDWGQLPRITNERNEIIVDFVGRFENLQADYNVVCENLELVSKPILHINESSFDTKHYWEYYDDESATIVAAIFEEDIERFNYTLRP